MKKIVSKILCLSLVVSLFMTSFTVTSVNAAVTNPMQTVLLNALALNDSAKAAFDAALVKSETNIDGAATDIHNILPAISAADAKLALGRYLLLSASQKNLIHASILVFTLNEKSYDGNGFDTIIDKVNTEITGSASNNQGVSLIIQIIQFLNRAGKNSAWVTDSSSDTNKIQFAYNSNDNFITLAKTSLNALIDSMESLKAKISSASGTTTFDKLLNYTADVMNDSTVPASERTALKSYLNSINDSYYVPYESKSTSEYVAPTSGTTTGTTAGTTTAPSTTSDVDKIWADIQNLATTNETSLRELEKSLANAVEKQIESVGAVTVTPSVSGATVSVSADQIKVADIIAKADAVIANAAELAQKVGNMDITIEKKVVINIGNSNVPIVKVTLPSELLTKVQGKGIEKVEIASGDVKLSINPAFVKEVAGSKTVSFEINKVTVNDELKSKMTDEQKKLLSANSTVLNFTAAIGNADGTQSEITKFDKFLKIKVKYALNPGESKDKITVLYLADDGSIQNMIARYDEKTGEVAFGTDHFGAYIVKNLVKSFSDVKSGAWYKTQAESLAAKGIVQGVDSDNFKPDANVTRAEFLTMLVKAKGVYDKNATYSFSDVNENSWYYTYVASAVKAGIVGGMGDGKFAPDSLITREQMSVMITNALASKAVVNSDNYLTASDVNKISTFAKSSMALCVKNGFIKGSDNRLDPKGNATRGMAAVVVYKYFNYIY